ncbi:hypothetical protein [Moraxella lacunata]|uniref:hypothetical protein n=1 Tax=Moraxella lacunata TaxID=477 RepID=UPI003EDFA96E
MVSSANSRPDLTGSALTVSSWLCVSTDSADCPRSSRGKIGKPSLYANVLVSPSKSLASILRIISHSPSKMTNTTTIVKKVLIAPNPKNLFQINFVSLSRLFDLVIYFGGKILAFGHKIGIAKHTHKYRPTMSAMSWICNSSVFRAGIY